MAVISVGRLGWGWLVLLLGLVSCGAPGSRSVTPSTPATLSATPATPDSGDPTLAGWADLVADERIWRRPDLDRRCDAAQAGFFMPRPLADAAPPPPSAAELGCTALAEPAAPGERILGTSYCCPRSRTAPPPHTAGAASCEQAVADYVQRVSDAPPPDDNAGSSAAILNRGSYFEHCGVPNSTGIDICAAILEGRAVGVTVRTTPVSAANAVCIAESVLRLTFPSNARMDVARTRF